MGSIVAEGDVVLMWVRVYIILDTPRHVETPGTAGLPRHLRQRQLKPILREAARMTTAPNATLFMAIARRLAASADDAAEELCEELCAMADSKLAKASSERLRAIDILVRTKPQKSRAVAIAHLAGLMGKEINRPPSVGELPPLHAAAHYGNFMAVEALIKAGADLSLKVNAVAARLAMGTAAHAALTGYRALRASDHAQVLALLCRAGADMNVVDLKRRRPVDLATEINLRMNDSTMINAMLELGVEIIGNAKGAHATDVMIQHAANRSGSVNHMVGEDGIDPTQRQTALVAKSRASPLKATLRRSSKKKAPAVAPPASAAQATGENPGSAQAAPAPRPPATGFRRKLL